MATNAHEQIRQLLAQGLSSEDVAQRLDIAKGRVSAVRAHMAMGTYEGASGTGSGVIYLQREGKLIPMSGRPYATEDDLQSLLADHPGLLAGDEVGETPRRWILLSREMKVADQDGATGRWSVDHLFVDQDAIPTLVEVKRSSDTRIRREVVGQLLEYAANGTRYWPVEQLRARYEANCQTRNAEPTQELREAFGEDFEVDAWWSDVSENLQRGRMRLVFVADVIGRELRRIIEFLNKQMTLTEVLGVEIRQYADERGEHQTYVPRLIGQDEESRAVKRPASRPTRRWDEKSFVAEAKRRHDSDIAGIAHTLIRWAEAHEGVRVDYGKGASDGSAQIRLEESDAELLAFNIWTYGTVEIPFDFMNSFAQAPFAESRTARDELRSRINEAVPLAQIPSEETRRRPSFRLAALHDQPVRENFLAAIEWAFEQSRAAQSQPSGT
ncbi:MAG: hypothetical protein WKF41_18980 [Gaiellaceae bacterium]